MAELDAAQLADKAVRLGLLAPDQVQQAWDELGKRGGEAEPFLLLMERKGYLTPWQTSKLLKGDDWGYVLGGYRILYKIASGSFGRVYRAADPRTGAVVAVKTLRRKWSEDAHTIELFEREGKMGMALKHPNIVEILAVNRDQASRQYYIVMEFVEGGNLREILTTRKKFDPPDALRILEDATAGLAFAFSKGVTHRDMKLTNVLISSQGTAKLVDFGLAGLYGKAQVNEKVTVDRTVDYAGLEKATGVPPGDTRSDIFFLGCVAYEMLTGRSPLDMTRDPRARMSRERFTNIQPMAPDEVGGPPSLFRLVEKMMSFNPQERYQTPSQLLDRVREVRREVEGKGGGGGKPATRQLFIVEKNEQLQDVLREKFKAHGFRVLLAADPVRALDRFRLQPYDCLILDARTADGSTEEAVHLFERVLAEAERQQSACGGIVIFGEDQGEWAGKVQARPNVATLRHPVTFKQLLHKVQELVSRPA